MWGYGTTGGRGYKYAKDAVDSGQLGVSLSCATSLIAKHDLLSAYRALSGKIKIKGYGEPFFTKYLYFLARGDGDWPNDKDKPRPQILDSRVLESLRVLHETFGANLGKLGSFKSQGQGRYVCYCRTLAGWACQLSCEAEQIERFLFEKSFDKSFLFAAGEKLRELATTVLDAVNSDEDANALRARLNDAIGKVPSDLIETIKN